MKKLLLTLIIGLSVISASNFTGKEEAGVGLTDTSKQKDDSVIVYAPIHPPL